MAPLSLFDNNNEVGRFSQRQESPTLGFTSALLENIRISEAKIQRWAEMEKSKVDNAAESYRLKLLEEQSAIDSHVTDLLSIQLERGLKVNDDYDDNDNDSYNKLLQQENRPDDNIVTQTRELEEEMVSLEVEVSKLQHEFEKREKRLSDIALEESKQRTRADEARALKERVQEARQMTVDDLTRGIVNYKYLGLDFERTGVENEMRFCFSRLDAHYSERQFSFVLQVLQVDNGTEKYEISDCLPAIETSTLHEVTHRLNETDDMSYLVRRMRQAFVETL